MKKIFPLLIFSAICFAGQSQSSRTSIKGPYAFEPMGSGISIAAAAHLGFQYQTSFSGSIQVNLNRLFTSVGLYTDNSQDVRIGLIMGQWAKAVPYLSISRVPDMVVDSTGKPSIGSNVHLYGGGGLLTVIPFTNTDRFAATIDLYYNASGNIGGAFGLKFRLTKVYCE